MRVTVFGATGGIGRAVVERALAAGHEVVAFTRDAARLHDLGDRVSVVTGDAEDPLAVERAVAGSDAVVNALGPTTNGAAEVERAGKVLGNIVTAMRHSGVRRLVSLSGAAVVARGEHKPLGARIAGALVRLAVRHVVAAKQLEYELLVDSDLDWTAVRPPRVVDRPGSGRYQLGEQLASRTVSRGDLGLAIVDLLGDDRSIRTAPYVSG